MTSRRPTYLTHSFQRHLFVCVVLSVQVLCLLPTISVCRAEDTPDPYDAIYDVIMLRKDSDGKAYSTNEIGPLIYGRSKFPFDDETFPSLTAAMEGFNALSQQKIESYGTVTRSDRLRSRVCHAA